MEITAMILLYLLVTLAIGVRVARRVHNTEDYLLAGRRLPYFMVSATLFATWFGSETILGASAEFAEGGLIAVVRDPFGAALCLILVGAFYAKPLYRMKLLTLGDFFRVRYGALTERLTAIFMTLSFLTWIAAQFVAFGIIVSVLTGIPVITGFLAAGVVVTTYTFIGGMWSVSVTDTLQMVLILAGLVAASLEVFGIISPITLIAEAPEGFFRFLPEQGVLPHADYVAAWITIGLGSIASQDVFQRIMAARSEKVAVRSAFTAAALYLSVAMIPLLLVLAGIALGAHTTSGNTDTQLIIPHMILTNTSPFVKVLFFGALLSAILSTASSALLAPAAILSENIIKPLRKEISDKKLLLISRLSVIVIAALATAIALYSGNIYQLVGEAASLGLVALFVPLTAGLFIKKTTPRAANASILAGVVVWISAHLLNAPSEPILYGLTAAIIALFSTRRW